DGQQTDEGAPAEAEDSLFEPVAGRFGAHGRFDARSRNDSLQWELWKHRQGVAAVALLAFAGLATALACLSHAKNPRDHRRHPVAAFEPGGNARVNGVGGRRRTKVA